MQGISLVANHNRTKLGKTSSIRLTALRVGSHAADFVAVFHAVPQR